MRMLVRAMVCAAALSWVPAACGEAAAQEQAPALAVRKVLLYLPNRVLDLLDVAGLNLSFGYSCQANLHLTRYVQLGRSAGHVRRVGTMGREAGIADQHHTEIALGPWGSEQLTQEKVCGSWRDLALDVRGWMWDVPLHQREQWRHKRDRYGLGMRFHALIIGGQLELRPREAADFFLSLVGIDFTGDDKQ